MRNVVDCLRLMSDGAHITFSYKHHAFSFYNNSTCYHPSSEVLYPNSVYGDLFHSGGIHNLDMIENGMAFEDHVKNYMRNHYIDILETLIDNKCSLKMLSLIASIKPYLKYKHSKSITSFYKFILKMEQGKVKYLRDKRISAISKKKIIHIKTNIENYKIIIQKRQAIKDVITSLGKNHHSIRVKNIKVGIINILEKYLQNDDMLETFTKHNINKDMSKIFWNQKLTFNKIINYIPDLLFNSLNHLISDK